LGIHSIATAFSFTLDTTPPVLVFTSESVSGGGNKLTLTGISDPNSVVTIKDGLAIVGTTTAANDGTWSFNASKITDTVHIYTATATDAAGNTGASSNESILGSSSENILTGTSGSDYINGLNGNDTITGGLGSDWLTGGAGKNHFVYNSTAEGMDHIVDFGSGDVLDFNHSSFGNLATGNASSGTLDPSHFASNATGTATAATAQFVYNTTNHTLYYDADGTGTASAAIAMAKLENGAALHNTDIHLI
jgi:Ca2+-binding RTX toxin-like protein